MNSIKLEKAGKRYNNRWLFHDLNYEINEGDKLAILGINGSGKSTLLQMISGFISPTAGTVVFNFGGESIAAYERYKFLTFAAPYTDLIDDFTLSEFVSFYIKHKSLMKGITPSYLIELAMLSDSTEKVLKSFSSGMRQRLKLACALLTDVELVLLDEPLTNLDANGILFYKNLVGQFTTGKILVVCSNNLYDEISCCTKQLVLGNDQGVNII